MHNGFAMPDQQPPDSAPAPDLVPGLVSVVIPAYNAERFLGEAVTSVAAQTYAPIEIIIVDDGSRDGTADLIRQLEAKSSATLPVRGLFQANAGPSAARNAGLDAARGEYLAFLDADDRLLPDKIAAQADVLKRDPAIGLVSGGWRIITEEGQVTRRGGGAAEGVLSFETLLYRNEIATPSAILARTAILRQLGGFDRALRYAEDLELWLRLALLEKCRIWNLGRPVFDRREREGQATKNWSRMREGWLVVLERVRKLAPDRVRPHAGAATALNERYSAFLAYEAGDYKAARQLVIKAWSAAPFALLRSRYAYMTTFAVFTSLLPAKLHKAIEARIRGAREGT